MSFVPTMIWPLLVNTWLGNSSAGGPPLESPSLAAYVEQWVARKRGKITWVTAKFYEQVIPIARPLRRHLDMLSVGDDPRAPLFPAAFKIATANRDMSALSQQFHDLFVAAGLALPRPPKPV